MSNKNSELQLKTFNSKSGGVGTRGENENNTSKEKKGLELHMQTVTTSFLFVLAPYAWFYLFIVF